MPAFSVALLLAASCVINEYTISAFGRRTTVALISHPARHAALLLPGVLLIALSEEQRHFL